MATTWRGIRLASDRAYLMRGSDWAACTWCGSVIDAIAPSASSQLAIVRVFPNKGSKTRLFAALTTTGYFVVELPAYLREAKQALLVLERLDWTPLVAEKLCQRGKFPVGAHLQGQVDRLWEQVAKLLPYLEIKREKQDARP
jgi:hypothetical protein